MKPGCDIGILTIKIEEFEAVLDAFPNGEGRYVGPLSHRHYNLRTADAGNGREYDLAIVRHVEQGTGDAQSTARDLIEELSPKLILVVGIAGARPTSDFTLGDVVLSTRVNDYTVHADNSNGEPTYALSGGPVERSIAGGIANLAARRADLGEWAAMLPSRPPVDTISPKLVGPKEWQGSIQDSIRYHFQTKTRVTPLFRDGVIGSSDGLIKDPLVLIKWLDTARNLLVVEMESAGVYRAAAGRCGWLAIRAVSDIVGLSRDEEWTKYAALSAAAFTRAYLRTTPVIDKHEDSSPTPTSPEVTSSAEAPKNSAATTSAVGSPATNSNVINVAGSTLENVTLVAGDATIHIRPVRTSLDTIESMVDNGVLDDALIALQTMESNEWQLLGPMEKYRHRKLRARIKTRQGNRAAGAADYLAACDFVPEDEKTLFEKGVAYLLRDDKALAHDHISEVLRRWPNFQEARALWIRTAPAEQRAISLVPQPWKGLHVDVAAALAERLLEENDFKSTIEVLKSCEASLKLDGLTALSTALLKRAEQVQSAEPNDAETLLVEAVDAMEAAYRLCRGQSMKEAKMVLLQNLGYAYHLLRRDEDEWRMLVMANELDPAAQNVRIRRAQWLLDHKKPTEALEIFENEMQRGGPPFLPLLLAVALFRRDSKGDVERGRVALVNVIENSQAERQLRLDCVETLMVLLRKRKEWDAALDACLHYASVLGEIRCTELRVMIYLEQEDKSAALAALSPLYEKRVSYNQSELKLIGTLYYQSGDNERTFELLSRSAPRDRFERETAALLNAAQATNRHEFVIRLCRDLNSKGIIRASLVEAEAVALARRGELGLAIDTVQSHLQDHENPFLRLCLSQLAIMAGRSELIETDPARLPSAAESTDHVAVITAEVLRAGGVQVSAIKFAYDYYREHRGDLFAWRAILAAFFPPRNAQRDDMERERFEPKTVECDTAVMIKDGARTQWIVIENQNPQREFGEFPLEHPFVQAMLGKEVGAIVEMSRLPLPSRKFEIVTIQSKYVRCYQDCLERWEETFPESPGPRMLEISDDVEQFADQLLPMLQQQQREVERLDRIYADNVCSLHMLANEIGNTIFAVIAHLIVETEIDVRCTRGEIATAVAVRAEARAGRRLILESTALATVLLLCEADLLKLFSKKILISRATMDELRGHLREVSERASAVLKPQGEQLCMLLSNDEDRQKYRDSVARLIDVLSADCEIFEEREHVLLNPTEWDKLISIGGAGFVESLHRCMRTGDILWTDDFALAVIAESRKAHVAWSQLVVSMLLEEGAIDQDRAFQIGARLIGWRYISTHAVPGVFVAAAKIAQWNPERWPLKQHLRLFATEAWENLATVRLAAQTLRELWRASPMDTSGDAVTVAMLEHLVRRKKGEVVIEMVARVLEQAFGLDVLTYARARDSIEAWRATQLRINEV